MAYKLSYSDYSTASGPPDPAAWVGPPGPPGPPSTVPGPPGPTGGASVTVAASAPATGPGSLWWDDTSGQLYLNYDDGNSIQWVVANNNAIEGAPFLPLTGGTMTGPLNVTDANGYTRQWLGQSFFDKFVGSAQSGNAGVIAERRDVYNTSTAIGQGTRYAYYTQATALGNDIGHTDLLGVLTTSPPGVGSFLSYMNYWIVHVSPLDTAGNWWSVPLLINPVHRGDDLGWTSVAGTRARYTGGIAINPETTDFQVPPAGAVFGNILFAYAVSRSNGVNSAGHVAQSYNGLLIEQNAIAPNGRGIYVGGYVAATGVPSSVLPYAPMQANDAWQNGIDFGGATFTNFAFRSPGFAVDSVGNLSANNVLSTAGHVGSHSAYNPTVGCYDTGQAAGAGLLLGGGSLLYIASLNAAGDYVGTRCTIDTSGNVNATGGVGVFGHTAPVSRPTVSGAKGSNAALASLLTALAAYGLVTDSTTA